MASFLAFFMLGYDENIASADEKCALAVHDATRNATRNQCTRSLFRARKNHLAASSLVVLNYYNKYDRVFVRLLDLTR